MIDTSHQPILRFAPSPNGPLHLGHAYSALKTWEIAERIGGTVLLRIEDIDTQRSRSEFIEQAKDDLTWLGLKWPEPVRHQSGHFADYQAAARQLEDMGLLYPCFATRREISEAATGQTDPDGAPLYPGLWKSASREEVARRMAANEPHALRIDMAAATKRMGGPLTTVFMDDNGTSTEKCIDPSVWGDAVIVRKETPTSYHLSVVVDDALQSVTHVTRGQDIEPATSLHRLLQTLLGLPAPVYHHHALITDSAGRKLSKRFQDAGLQSLRDEGWTPDDVRAAVGL